MYFFRKPAIVVQNDIRVLFGYEHVTLIVSDYKLKRSQSQINKNTKFITVVLKNVIFVASHLLNFHSHSLTPTETRLVTFLAPIRAYLISLTCVLGALKPEKKDIYS